ncbi:hypothetical protein T484DRAFT_1829935 [Baffinella frigidus]|nr:hypothetical protein T484DRAFT_1829935 [Cryptophyta sp. CCMP2293]
MASKHHRVLPPLFHKVLFGGRLLEQGQSLKDYRVRNNSTLHIEVGLKLGGLKLSPPTSSPAVSEFPLPR